MNSLKIIDLSYKYPSAAEPIFHALNLDFEEGWSAITGVNGSGKSTLLKLISKGKDRGDAIAIMLRALNELIIDGIHTNIDLHKWILKQPVFVNGEYNTNWLEKNISNFQ